MTELGSVRIKHYFYSESILVLKNHVSNLALVKMRKLLVIMLLFNCALVLSKIHSF